MIKKEDYVLVTGGAGYIRSVVVENLIAKGYNVIVIDDLRDSHRNAVPADVIFFEKDSGDKNSLEEIFHNYKIYIVMHFAASANVPLSVKHPQEFYYNNVVGSLVLFKTMVKYNVKKIIFSSTAAVYGEPIYTPVNEKHPLNIIEIELNRKSKLFRKYLAVFLEIKFVPKIKFFYDDTILNEQKINKLLSKISDKD